MGTVYRGEYVVDPLAVAEAIVERSLNRRRRRSKVLEASETGSDRPVRAHELDAATGTDVP